jgi:hypothetical protein
VTNVLRNNLELTGLMISIIGGVAGIAGMVGAFYVIPYRMEAAETQIRHLSASHEKDHELLNRIEERLIAIQKSVERK